MGAAGAAGAVATVDGADAGTALGFWAIAATNSFDVASRIVLAPLGHAAPAAAVTAFVFGFTQKT